MADKHSVHILIDAQLVRTLPSNLPTEDLHELRLRGAVPAGPPPADPAVRNRSLPGGAAVEVDRTVNADAAAESFNATFKHETLQGRLAFADEREARLTAFR